MSSDEIVWNEPPTDVEWNEWGPAVRVQVDHAPVALFARAVKDTSAVYRSETAAHSAGFDRVPVPPTFTFVMSDSGAYPDLQPAGGTGSMYAASGHDAAQAFARDGLFLHGEQHFAYHRQVCVGDVLEGRLRTSRPVARTARRGPMEVTWFQTHWTELDGTPVVDEQIVSLFFPNG
ncbi:MAG TPA: MaoC family dehydratase N-terminal domain-containing protein [Acidimicrobiia bacterium]|nr:MaoC family dehydratase N-terminal domain-containing protein [Acidimicrobiia bacterium]